MVNKRVPAHFLLVADGKDDMKRAGETQLSRHGGKKVTKRVPAHFLLVADGKDDIKWAGETQLSRPGVIRTS